MSSKFNISEIELIADGSLITKTNWILLSLKLFFYINGSF